MDRRVPLRAVILEPERNIVEIALQLAISLLMFHYPGIYFYDCVHSPALVDQSSPSIGSVCSESQFRFLSQAIVPKDQCEQYCAQQILTHQETLRLSVPDICQVLLPDAPYDLLWYAPSYRTGRISQQDSPEHDVCVCEVSLRIQRQRRGTLQSKEVDCSKEAVGKRLAFDGWSLLEAPYVPPSKHANVSMQPSYEPESCRAWDVVENPPGPTMIVKYGNANRST